MILSKRQLREIEWSIYLIIDICLSRFILTGFTKKSTNCVKFVILSSEIEPSFTNDVKLIDLTQLQRDFHWGFTTTLIALSNVGKTADRWSVLIPLTGLMQRYMFDGVTHMSLYQKISYRNKYQLDCVLWSACISDPNFRSACVPQLTQTDLLPIIYINPKRVDTANWADQTDARS
jgi:hypothetical protein